MKPLLQNHWLISSALLSGLWMSDGAIAQVTADGTLSTVVNSSDGQNFLVEGGDRVGTNLFHSFNEFSIPSNGSAYFNQGAEIQNIFSRVTGNSISNINGLIRANGNTNLFLLNPNGILFGPDAQLVVGGSFIGSTASHVWFADGNLFPARSSNPSSTLLLTVSVPVGLQMGRDSGVIRVEGGGSPGTFAGVPTGLVVAPGRTLALVGNGVTFDGGIGTALGRLEVGSVATGRVNLQPTPTGWQLGYDAVQEFQDIQLLNRSALWNPNLGLDIEGGIQIYGRNITIDNSQIATQTLSSQRGENIEVRATDALTMGGVNQSLNFPYSSWIGTIVAPSAKGTGGNLEIIAPQIRLQDGAAIQTLSLGDGAAGTVQVIAEQMDLFGFSPLNADPSLRLLDLSSSISTQNAATGAGGNIGVTARNLNLQNGGLITTRTLPAATGGGGDITVQIHNTLQANGLNPFTPISASGVTSLNFGAGTGGNLRVQVGQLQLTGGAAIGSYVLTPPGFGLLVASRGTAGNVSIAATESINVIGIDEVGRNQVSQLGSYTLSSGRGGDVTLTTRQLNVRAGGTVSTGVLTSLIRLGEPLPGAGTGQGGDLTIDASEGIVLTGIASAIADDSDISTFTFGTGNAGNIQVRTPHLQILQDGTLGSATLAAGNSGQLTIVANEIVVVGGATESNNAVISAAASIPNAAFRQAYFLPDMTTGNTGEVVIRSDRLTLTNGGGITVQHDGTGNAGQLSITTNSAVIQSGGYVAASTASGEGGGLTLQFTDLLLLQNNGSITAEARGSGNGGNISVNAGFIVSLNNSDIIANAVRGRGGNIQINTQGLFGAEFRNQQTSNSDITASSEFGISGDVRIATLNIEPDSALVQLPADLLDSSQQISDTCTYSQESRFVVTGRGGVLASPTQLIQTHLSWQDLRDLSTHHNPAPPTSPSATNSTNSVHSTPLVIEATEARVDAQGQVELVAMRTNSIAQDASVTCSAALVPEAPRLR